VLQEREVLRGDYSARTGHEASCMSCSVFRRPAYLALILTMGRLLTDDQVLQDIQNAGLLLVIATKEAQPSATPKHLGSTLVRPPQLEVRLALSEIVLLAKLGAPEGKTVGVDGIVRSAADQAVRCDVLVVVKLVYDGLVELS
jgi:hypothetical protein